LCDFSEVAEVVGVCRQTPVKHHELRASGGNAWDPTPPPERTPIEQTTDVTLVALVHFDLSEPL
jgi:hypothetical protein